MNALYTVGNAATFTYNGKDRTGEVVVVGSSYLKLKDANDGTTKTFSFDKIGK